MFDRVFASIAMPLALTLAPLSLLAGCGGAGGKAAGDIVPVTVNPMTPPVAVAGPDHFLQFPNPQLLADGTFETDSDAYAQAYYRAIDPDNAKDTLTKWKAANRFSTTPGALGEVSAVFGDVRDLGYGRRVTARQNSDGTIAVMVDNFLVNTGVYAYSKANLNAAVEGDKRWHWGTSAIEYSPGPGGTVKFAKFYTFDAETGQRQLTANLDGRGNKAMPSICINCHGGRADPLTPPGADGKPLFPLIANSVSQQRGDTQAKLQMLDADSLDFSTAAGFTRSELEASIKTINKMVLCSYPIAAPSTAPEDACRMSAGPNEWQGTADSVLKAAYGGDGLPKAAFSGAAVPGGWLTSGQSTLYQRVAQPACMTCHMLRGTANQSDINFMTYANFQGYADLIKAHVFERGDMPLAKIVADQFWGSDMAAVTATWLQEQLPVPVPKDAAGAPLKPGRPIAIPGPDRIVKTGASTISGAGSLFSTGYQWTLSSNPGNAAALTGATSAAPVLSTAVDGKYVLQLVTSNGALQSTPAFVTVIVKAALTPDPQAIRFNDLRPVLSQPSCAGCHSAGTGAFRAPIFFNDIDRNGDGIISDASDKAWFYKEVRGRINFTDIAASPLLQKPAGSHHAGKMRPGFDATLPPGDPGRVNYDLFLNWILNGAPM